MIKTLVDNIFEAFTGNNQLTEKCTSSMTKLIHQNVIARGTDSAVTRLPPCAHSLVLSSWSRKRKEGSVWIASSPWSHPSPSFWTRQSYVLSTNWTFECKLPFIDNPMVITVPAIPSERLWALGSKLYVSNMQRMLNKNLTGFMQSPSNRQTKERLCWQSARLLSMVIRPGSWVPWNSPFCWTFPWNWTKEDAFLQQTGNIPVLSWRPVYKYNQSIDLIGAIKCWLNMKNWLSRFQRSRVSQVQTT